MANRIVKIEDICHVVKGETGIMKAIPGEYPMVVLSEERKTHNEYQFDCKAVIIPLVSSTGHGHASMKRIHFQEGKFALGSILCALIPKNEGEYDPEYLYHILDMGKERIFVPLMKGMANVSLPMNRIKSVEINLPPFDEQVRLSKIYSEVATNLDLLKNQTDKQHKYLKQLRQSILQLAVQGKLTTKWRELNPDIEPAIILLEKIKTEKEQLFNNGKIRREKQLVAVSDIEKLYEIPNNWQWSRIGTINYLKSGNSYSLRVGEESDIPYVKVGDMNLTENKLEINSSSSFYKYENSITNQLIPVNSVIFPKRGGAIATNKRKKVLKKEILIDSNTMAVVVSKFLNFDYFFHWFTTIDLSKFGNDAVIPQVNNKDIDPIPIPIPPFEEQAVIVEKLNYLMLICDELEKKIEKRDSYQERIMQSVVRQVFTTKLETVETE